MSECETVRARSLARVPKARHRSVAATLQQHAGHEARKRDAAWGASSVLVVGLSEPLGPDAAARFVREADLKPDDVRTPAGGQALLLAYSTREAAQQDKRLLDVQRVVQPLVTSTSVSAAPLQCALQRGGQRHSAPHTAPALLASWDAAGRSRRYRALHRAIEHLMQQQRERDEQPHRRLRGALEAAVAALWPGAALLPFGSTTTGLYSKYSDTDYTVDAPGAAPLEFLQRLCQLFERGGGAQGIAATDLTHSRVSHVVLRDLASGAECDVSCNNKAGVHNSALIRDYAAYDPRVRPLLMLVRAWGKNARVVDSKHGGLAAYTAVLLALHFLQRGLPEPLLPVATSSELVGLARQRAAGYELVRLDAGIEYARVRAWHSRCQCSPEELFHRFLVYYGYQVDLERCYVDTRESVVGPKTRLTGSHASLRSCPVVVLDPLRDINVAPVREDKARQIVRQFRLEAHKIANM